MYEFPVIWGIPPIPNAEHNPVLTFLALITAVFCIFLLRAVGAERSRQTRRAQKAQTPAANTDDPMEHAA